MTDVDAPKRPRFLTIEQVTEELAVGLPTVRMLLKSGELRGLLIGRHAMWRVANKDLEDYIEQAATTRSIQRAMAPEDLVGAVLFLSSPESNFVSGQTFVVDGGGVMS